MLYSFANLNKAAYFRLNKEDIKANVLSIKDSIDNIQPNGRKQSKYWAKKAKDTAYLITCKLIKCIVIQTGKAQKDQRTQI